MTKYIGNPEYDHQSPEKIGILILNLGTPDEPTTSAVRRYLKEFLSDPRVIEMPRLLWWLILNLVILNIRPARSAKAYREIWTDEGSPLLTISQQQINALKTELNASSSADIQFALGMRYGKPSIKDALNQLREKNVRKLLVLPMYPQYSATTTASTFDAIADELKQWRWLPELRFITHYHDKPGYIKALANSVRKVWQQKPAAEKLLLSFHGLPKRYLEAGDPYYCECTKTARLLAEELNLEKEQWQLTFQSRVGREEWLTPYTDKQLEEWAQAGINSVDVICPGFSADCLETLEEIAMQNCELFMEHGGKEYRYIPCLNDEPEHISFLAELCRENIQDWLNATITTDTELSDRRQRAISMGANN